MTRAFPLPVRLAWGSHFSTSRPVPVIAGTKGSHGDAGWTVLECHSNAHRLEIMRSYPQARMPCWARFETR
jgi:hypothetical protein